MFTGIVQTMGKVASITPTPAGVRFIIDRRNWKPDGITLHKGDSVCVSGVCLTVVDVNDATVAFDVIGETLAKTTLGGLKPGDHVNLEPSLTATTAMGGHFVQGHIEGVGNVTDVTVNGDDYRIIIQPPAELMEYIVPKGSITADGVSMTVAAVTATTFSLALIPTTLNITTLGAAKRGSKVNIETDIISRTVVHWLRQRSQSSEGPKVTMQLLREAGLA